MRLINADKLTPRCMFRGRCDSGGGSRCDRCTDYAVQYQDIEDAPTVSPERKMGRWIESNPQDSKVCRLMTCSECGKAYIVNINVPYEDWTEAHKFCVDCGADMRGEQE